MFPHGAAIAARSAELQESTSGDAEDVVAVLEEVFTGFAAGERAG